MRNMEFFRTRMLLLAAVVSLPATVVAVPQPQEPYRLEVVLTLPNTDKVEVKKDVIYKGSGESALKMDLYYPPGFKAPARLPAVIFVNGVGDPVGRPKLKDWGQYTSWARLTSSSGLIAINYESNTNSVAADAEALIDYVRTNAGSLGVDENKLGFWSCSANVRIAFPIVMQPARKYIKAAVFYYGATVGASARTNVPLLIGRAGQDVPTINTAIDAFIHDGLAKDVPIVMINYVDGQHGFDLRNDTDESRQYVQQTLDFLTFHLLKNRSEVAQSSDRAPTPTAFTNLINDQGIQRALEVFAQTKKTHPQATLFQENVVNVIGYQLIQTGKLKEAIEVFKLNIEAYPNSANVYDSLADAYEADGKKDLAIQLSEKALNLLASDTQMPEQFKENIRRSASEKLKRLKNP